MSNFMKFGKNRFYFTVSGLFNGADRGFFVCDLYFVSCRMVYEPEKKLLLYPFACVSGTEWVCPILS